MRRNVGGVIVAIIILTGCGIFGTTPETPAERLAALEIASQEVDAKIVELVDLGIIRGDLARKIDAATIASDAAIDAARVTMRTGGDMDPSVDTALAAIAAVNAILIELVQRE